MKLSDMKKKKQLPENNEAEENDDHEKAKAEAAETDSVTRNPKTIMHTTYRGTGK